eukprot:CAMPEP_0204259088 /NCGR_PEP_ID=MMETSP0468-20130131/5385_1 /ASSEMBLY_ACC=CAM_ASM_000383 /TAXON_ID=2969 /ORGANISM="Oxyrrhis marina" /LENGTH=68 /DNA_ID=CAMNT_0051233327 /DNA_START=24 /DNA_END=227 /DNA_ORIENTATION=-
MPQSDHEPLGVQEPFILTVGGLIALSHALARDLESEFLLKQISHVVLGDSRLGNGVHQINDLVKLHDA